ncbi:MAG: cellulase family glycosylhydrolase [Chloroflexi bacterium]|nr:cellulase family glycosylhydrolase [Chloroflexota bacterium]
MSLRPLLGTPDHSPGSSGQSTLHAYSGRPRRGIGRQPARRRWIATILGTLLLFAGLAGLVVAFRQPLWDRLDLETRHRLIAAGSHLTARHVETADDVAVSPRIRNPVGVNVFLDQEVSIADRERSLAMLRAAGVGWIRQQVPWKDIERDAKGDDWDRKWNKDAWTNYDNVVDLAQQYGIDVIARVDTSPAWARPSQAGDADWHQAPPERFEDYGDFLHTLASRYRGKVRAYQVWNEPNLAIEWGQQAPDPAAYARLLRIAYARIKEADPDAIVLSAAMAPTLEESERALNELVFLQRMYDAGARGSFDVLGVQAYGLRSGPDDLRVEADDVNFSRTMVVRELMVHNGDAARPVWATEMGWNAPPSGSTEPIPYGAVSEALQAKYTVRAFERARQEWPWMGVMAIWFFKLPEPWSAQPWHYFQMVGPDFTPHPVYQAIRDYAVPRYGRPDAAGSNTPSAAARR